MKKLVVVLWCFAGILLGVGVAGDITQWWEHYPFLTNIVSSLAAACFGVPVALVAIQQVYEYQATVKAERTAARRIHALTSGIQSGVDALVAHVERDGGLVRLAFNVKNDLYDVKELSRERISLTRVLNRDDRMEVRSLIEKLDSINETMEQRFGARYVGYHRRLEDQWEELQAEVSATPATTPLSVATRRRFTALLEATSIDGVRLSQQLNDCVMKLWEACDRGEVGAADSAAFQNANSSLKRIRKPIQEVIKAIPVLEDLRDEAQAILVGRETPERESAQGPTPSE